MHAATKTVRATDAARDRHLRPALETAPHITDPEADAPASKLLSRCRAGDTQAWTSLVDRYGRLVFSIGLRNGLRREDAADLIQSTFLALLESIDDIEAEEKLPFWLMTVARRQAWRVRTLRNRECAAPDDQPDPMEDPTAEWERTAALNQALQNICRPCRDLLYAMYFDPTEPSYSQIAQRIGCAIGSLGPQRLRCLQRLRRLLGEDGA